MNGTSSALVVTKSEPRPDFNPIADYALLSDCSSAALVDRRGSIDWLCMPRYDSPALFTRILDPEAGHWSIHPTEPFTTERRYLPGTLVLETIFKTASGSVATSSASILPTRCCVSWKGSGMTSSS